MLLLPLPFGACAKAEAATVFSDLLDLELPSSFPAFEAGFLPVGMVVTFTHAKCNAGWEATPIAAGVERDLSTVPS